MTRVAAQIVVAVSAETCIAAIQQGMEEPRLKTAFRSLRPGKEYAGWVTAVEPGRRLEISYAALDPLTNRRMQRFGWRVRYDFAPAADGATRVEVAVEYGWLAALGGAGLLRAQAENEVARRLAALHTLELGIRVGAGGPAALNAGAPAFGTAPAPAEAAR